MGEIKSIESLVNGGKATAGPPLGPLLGPLGLNVLAVVTEINEATKTAVLTFTSGSSLIAQRTAGRQARGICKSGYMVKAGYRVAMKCDLQEVKGEMDSESRVKQWRDEGRRYV